MAWEVLPVVSMSKEARQRAIREASDALLALRRHERASATANGSACSVSPAQGALVHEVAIAGDAGTTTSALARRLGTSSSAVTQLVDGLVTGGVLTRESDPADRRKTSILLTERGWQMHREFDEIRLRQATSIFGGLSDEELGQLADLLGRVTKEERGL